MKNHTENQPIDNKDRHSSFGAMYQRKELNIPEDEPRASITVIKLLIVTVVSFLLPHIGIILYFLWHKEKPKAAKFPGIAALLSILLSMTIYFLSNINLIF